MGRLVGEPGAWRVDEEAPPAGEGATLEVTFRLRCPRPPRLPDMMLAGSAQGPWRRDSHTIRSPRVPTREYCGWCTPGIRRWIAAVLACRRLLRPA